MDKENMINIAQTVVDYLNHKAMSVEGKLDIETVFKSYDTQIVPWRKVATDPIACQKGCSYCCYLNVDTTQEEVDYIMDKFQKNEPAKYTELVKVALDRYKITKSMTDPDAIAGLKKPCMFLEDSKCSIYEDRPVACRSMYVTDVNMCRVGYEENAKVETAFHGAPMLMKDMIYIAMAAFKSKTTAEVVIEAIVQGGFTPNTMKTFGVEFISLEHAVVNHSKS